MNVAKAMLRLRALAEAIISNEPDDMVADGVTCLEVWRKEAKEIVQGLKQPTAKADHNRERLLQNVRDAINIMFLENPTPELAKKEMTQLKQDIDIILIYVDQVLSIIKASGGKVTGAFVPDP
jgi:polyhydroxyalkanoate synthesis regulator phasin